MPVSVLRRLSAFTESFRRRQRERNERKAARWEAMQPTSIDRAYQSISEPTMIKGRDSKWARKRHTVHEIRPVPEEPVTSIVVRRRNITERAKEEGWRRIAGGVVVRRSENKVEIHATFNWTAIDIRAVVKEMEIYRQTIVEADLDAPIAELLIVSLSVLDLRRWFAFQCYMKANDLFDGDYHCTCRFTKREDIYWPKLEKLTVCTTTKQAPHLSRLIDYGVSANYVIDRRVIDHLIVQITDEEKSPSEISPNIIQFRNWAGSAGFDERFAIVVGPSDY